MLRKLIYGFVVLMVPVFTAGVIIAQENTDAASVLRNQFISAEDTLFVPAFSTSVNLKALSSSGLAVSWQLPEGINGRVRGDSLYLDKDYESGVVFSLTALQGGNSEFTPAVPVSQVIVFTENPAEETNEIVSGITASVTELTSALNKRLSNQESGKHPVIECYPSPFSTNLTVRVENWDVPLVAKIYDINGQLKASSQLTRKETSFDLTGLTKGVYMVQIQGGGKEQTRRVFKRP